MSSALVGGKTLAEWRRTAFPGRREVTTPRDGLGKAVLRDVVAIRRICYDLRNN